MVKSFMKKRDGFTLIIVLLGLALMSILGIAIMGVTASNAKITKVDGQSQGTYYIAEAGLNKAVYDISKKVDELSQEQKTHDAFFNALDEYRDPAIPGGFEETLMGFENNFAQSPKAEVSIGSGLVVKEEVVGKYSERVVRYDIISKGEIGNSNRSVTTSIDVSHKIELNTGHHAAFDYALYSGGNNTFTLPGGAAITGSLYGEDLHINSNQSKIEGNIISEKSVILDNDLEIKGNVYAMGGTVKLANNNVKMTGNIYASDNVTLNSAVTLKGSIYTNKDVDFTSSGTKIEGGIHAGGNVKMTSGGYDIKIDKDVVLGGNLTPKEWGRFKVLQNVYAAGNIINGVNNEIGGDAVSAGLIIGNWTIGGGKFENADPDILQSPSPVQPEFEKYKYVDSVPLTSFTIGDDAQDVVQASHTFSHTISPGTYKDLILKSNDTVTLTTGNYYFNSIMGYEETKPKLKLDLSDGPINIYSAGDIRFGDNLMVYVSADGTNYRTVKDLVNNDQELAIELAGKVYWETHTKLELKTKSYFLGTVLANNNFVTENKATLIGAYIVKNGNISMNYQPTVIYAPPTDSAASGSGGGGDSAKGKNMTDEKDRVKSTKIIEQ